MPGRSLLFCISLSWRRSNEPAAEVALMARGSEDCQVQQKWVSKIEWRARFVRVSQFPAPSRIKSCAAEPISFGQPYGGGADGTSPSGVHREAGQRTHSAFDAIRVVAWGSEPNKHAAEALGYQPTNESYLCSVLVFLALGLSPGGFVECRMVIKVLIR
jgi:hypothetical protein